MTKKPESIYIRGKCVECGAPQKSKGRRNGKKIYRATCTQCTNKPWRKHRGDTCEMCGFIPIHPCQLDVDHIDGNKANNSKTNLQTLCANCHRLKTMMHGDYNN